MLIPQCINCKYCFADVDAVESTMFYWCDKRNHEVFPVNEGCLDYEQSTHWTFERDYPEPLLRRIFPEIER